MNIEKLLNVQNEVYKIPLYQRSYAWDRDQWTDLWDDLLQLKEGDTHFLGSIVVISSAYRKGLNYFEVVDGQQRLTTIMLILIALRDLIKTNNPKSATYISEHYLHSSTMSEESKKLKLGRYDDEVFGRLIDSLPLLEEHKSNKIVRAYNFYKKKIREEMSNWENINYKLLNDITIVLITTESHYDAFRLFETLNNRGLELSSVDLIKNELLRKVSDYKDTLDRCFELWDNIIRNLGDIDKVKFFRHYLFSTESGVVSKPQLFKKYQTVISTKDDLVAYLEDLFSSSEVYKKIHGGDFSSRVINERIVSLSRIEASTSYSLLLKILCNNDNIISEKDIYRIMKAIEIFALKRIICNTSTRDLDRIYNHLAIEGLNKESIVSYIVGYLQDRTPGDEEFYNNFKSKDFMPNDQTKYILETIENFMTNNTGELIINGRSNVHIEHIMPKDISLKMHNKTYNDDWKLQLGNDIKKHKDYVNKIGNLTLLGSGLNISASNNSFNNKKNNYAISNVKMTKDICDYDNWGIAEIDNRSDALAKIALLIWNYATV